MSNMLEQAILDAKTLRESALKTAEQAVVEKYSTEVRSAVEKLLEQEDDLDLGAEPEEEVDLTTTMEQVPMSHLSEEGDQVVVDLENILAAADEVPSDEEYEADLSDVADNIDVSLDGDLPRDVAPGNRDDEIDIDEAELVTMFKEMMVVDIPKVELEKAEEALTQGQLESDEETIYTSTDGMDEEDIKELERTRDRFMGVQEENLQLRTTLKEVKGTLEGLLLQNARLLYANRVLNDTSLNEQQKNRIAELVGNAQSVEEAKTIFETLQKTMAESRQPRAAQSLSEAITRRSSVVLTSRRSEEQTSTEGQPTYNRWATLAGTTK